MPEGMALSVLTENGYRRAICVACGAPFWSADPARDRCGDPPCVEYSFLGRPAISGSYTLDSMREAYLGFFEKHGHRRVARYPVVARWRDDVFLVNASIYDFQPHVTSGAVAPPANPLTISQPCIRLTDLDSVGRSGRHTSNFEMMAHHAFNAKSREIYWKEETVRLCMELLRSLGIPDHDVSYKENPWAGGGNAGAAFEVLVRGLELGTLVFMDLVQDPAGPTEVKGHRYRPMDLRVVDTGYGLERFLWMSTGTPTVYDSLYPDVVAKLFDLAGIVPPSKSDARMWSEQARLSGILSVDTDTKLRTLRERLVARLAEHGIRTTVDELERTAAPVESVYAVADHTRCLALLLGDDLVPSNAKAGYLVRLVIRKVLRQLESLGITTPLHELAFLHRQNLKGVLDLDEKADRIRRILDLETERYRETIDKGTRHIKRLLTGLHPGQSLTVDTLVDLYDTHGIRPELTARLASDAGLPLAVPDGFDSLVANRHAAPTAAEKDGGGYEEGRTSALFDGAVPTDLLEREPSFARLPATRKAYYEDTWLFELDATVLSRAGNLVILDQTVFYPEGGGQPCDLGTFTNLATGQIARVVDVQKVGNVVVHAIHPADSEGFPSPPGTRLHGTLDAARRTGHVRHHTGTHVVLAAARKVLGDHIWQAGAQKHVDVARLDVSHYQRITPAERRRIEEVANTAIIAGIPVTKTEMTRGEAEAAHGFRLYQGGPPATTTLRVVRIGDYDVQGCGGTHANNTREIGPVKVLRTERIQDGVVRIEYACGESALRHLLAENALLTEASEALEVTPEQLPKAVKRFFDEWKKARKEVDALRSRLAELQAGSSGPGGDVSDTERVGGVTLVARSIPGSREDLVAAMKGFSDRPEPERVVVWLATSAGDFVAVARSVHVDLRGLAKEILPAFGGAGGGKESFVQGRVTPDQVEPFLRRARDRTREQLAAAPDPP